MVAQVYSIFS